MKKKTPAVCHILSLSSPLSSLTRQSSHRTAQMYSLAFAPKSWSASSPLHMQIPRERSSSAPVPLFSHTGNDFGFALENVLRQTHLSISHNSFFTQQPRIDLLSQMRGHNKLFAVVPDTADNGNYSQAERAAPGREPTRYKIHMQRWF